MALMMRTMTGNQDINVSCREGFHVYTYHRPASQGRRRTSLRGVEEDGKGEVREAPDFRINNSHLGCSHNGIWFVHSIQVHSNPAEELIIAIASAILALLFPALILLHLFIAPYTKVEESFHVQAVHDILANGLPRGFHDLNLDRVNYDHFSFPGAVPRSALGAVALAMLSRPVIWLNEGINRQLLGTT